MNSEAPALGSAAAGMASEAAGMGSAEAGMGSEVARLLEAVDFAARKHKDQRRKDPEGTPYINHPIGAETPRHRVALPGDPRGPSLPEHCSPLGALPTPGSPSPWSLERTVSLFPYHALQPDGGRAAQALQPWPLPQPCVCMWLPPHCCPAVDGAHGSC